MRKKGWWIVGIFTAVVICFWGVWQFGTTKITNSQVKGSERIILTNSNLKISFSNPIKASSINSERIKVKDEQGKLVPITYKLSDDRKMLIVSPPKEGFNLQTKNYELSISDNITSSIGIPLLGEKKLAFTVAATLPKMQSKKQLQEYMKSFLNKERPFAKSEFFQSSREDKAEKTSNTSNDFSQTNTQVAGIDEGDVVKTDGKYIYTISNQQLFITQAVPAKSIKLTSSIHFKNNFYPSELMLSEHKLMVIGHGFDENRGKSTEDKVEKIMPNGYTKVFIYNISEASKPKLMKEIAMEGSYVTARKNGKFLYLVANQYPDLWMLREDTTAVMTPRFFDNEKGVYEQKVSQISYVPESNESNYVHMAAIDLEDEKIPYKIETLLGSGENIYMSEENMYIAATKYGDQNKNNFTQPYTEVYKFKIDGLNMTFSSMGEVEGRVLNQFSMDEHKGHFRVATTEDHDITKRDSSTNALFILNDNMKKVGEVNNLAKGERIYSVRFMGDKAYIVTFKQVDPLFVIDTSEPTKPKVLGELKIPGYSTYLHPYDENHLIGFGYHTELVKNNFGGEPNVRNKGMKISLFDITDFHNPKEKDSVIIGRASVESPILYDHKALFQHKDQHLFGFPITVYDEIENFETKLTFDGAMIYEITPEKGIVQKAKLANDSQKRDYPDYDEMIRRMIFIKNDIYSISNKRINAYQLSNYEKIGQVKLPLKY